MANSLSGNATAMHIPYTDGQARRGLARLAVFVLVVILSACATQHSAILKVNPRNDAGIQYSPQELANMMKDLGYQQLRVQDPVTEQSVTIAEKYGEYRMLFQSLDNDNIRVDIHIVKEDSRITLYFYNIYNSPLDNSSRQLYEQLQERLNLEYGAANVSNQPPSG